MKGSPFPESFRPDRLGMIVVVKTWRDHLAYVLVPAGKNPDAEEAGFGSFTVLPIEHDTFRFYRLDP